jgi:hypothetical protein
MNCQPASDGARLSYSGMRCRAAFSDGYRATASLLRCPLYWLSKRYSDQLRC